jgi:DNA-binding IclR family transcriptional regulator
MCEHVRERVFELLKSQRREMSASEIAIALDVPYLHVYRALVTLKLENKVTRRRVGKRLLLWGAVEVQ